MRKKLFSLLTGLLFCFSLQPARALDNGVDPYNLGKGEWIYIMSDAINHLGGHVSSVTSVSTLMSYLKSKGVAHVVVKAGTGATWYPSNSNKQFNSALVTAAHNNGLKIFGYSRSYGTDITGEVNLAKGVLALGADGFVIDAEMEWESANLPNNTTAATNLCQGIKAAYPNRFLAHSPLMYISVHSSFPFKQFGLFCDAVMPQCYWHEFGISASECADDLDTEWNNWQNGLTGAWGAAIKPICPIGQGWNGVTGTEITTFYNALKNSSNPATDGGYKGLNWWRAELHTSSEWTAIGANSIGIDPDNTPVISAISATQVGPTVATIIWTTDQGGNSIVDYGTTTSYGTSRTNSSCVISHSVALSGLTAGVTYHYRVRTKNPNGVLATSSDKTFTTPTTVPDVIIDNPAATMNGSWILASTSTDRYGSNYRYKSHGTGTGTMVYTPNILQSGLYNVYEWHPAGANRSTATPHIITYNGGSASVPVNQQINGGQWNLLATYNFNAGTAGSVKITDNNPDTAQLVMADAIRFARALPPAAPSGLALTPISTSQINIVWNDNSTNENNFIVARSTVSGGPYTDRATLNANVTSFTDTGLSASTRYYYVVRARNTAGDSANSAQANATTLPNVPAAPSGLTATATLNTTINLTWVDHATNENSFIVGRSLTSGGPYNDVMTLPGNTTAYSDAGLAANTTYYYVVRAANAGGSSANSSQASAVTLDPPPTITTQPISQTASQGGNVTFTVAATGVGPLIYQWKRDNVNISGATGSSYTRSNLGAVDAGAYTAVVNNPGGSTTSDEAVLTVNAAPVITAQPQAQTADLGGDVVFSVTVAGSGPMYYQWKFNGAAISGATDNDLAKENVQGSDVGYYSVVVSNAWGSVTSSSAALSLTSASLVSDDFESGNLSAWGIFSGATALSISTAQNHTTSGADSAYLNTTQAKMYRNLPSLVDGHSKTTFWIYDSALDRIFGEARSYAGGSYNNGGLQQVYAIGKFTSVSLPGDTYDATKYQGRVVIGSNVGWFNLNAAGAPNRSTGWHKFEIEVLSDGTTVNFYVDGVLGRQITGAGNYPLDDIIIGSVGTASTTGDAWFDDVKIEYFDAPSIASQPTSQTVNSGSSATFTVSASGVVTGYQWRKNGVEISGATTSSLVLNNVQSTDAGTYSVVVRNGVAPVASANATLTVNTGAPIITTQPVSQTLNQGSSATFSVVATGAPLTYQWTFNGVNISGATASAYTRSNIQPADAGSYAVIVSNASGNTPSANAVLTVNVPPSITTHPTSQTVNQGSSVSFSVVATGTAPLSYQWTFNGANISGATTSSYTKSNVQPSDAGNYAVVVSNVAGNATSLNATLTLNVPPSITTHPASQTVNQGANVTFSVVASGTAPLSYQWTFNGANISGATASSYTKSNVQSTDAGNYAVVVSNVAGNATSINAVLTLCVPPSITTQPASQTVNQGANATFTVTAAGTAPLSYQWKFNGANISGATASSYTKSNVQSTDAGSYSVTITNMAGTVTSANAVLTLNVPPSITTQPASQTVNQGANATFAVTAAGTAPLSYQWKFNGANISGATASSYSKSNVQPTDAGSYSVVVTNVAGSVTSANAVLTLNVAPSITTQPASQSVAKGANATFTVVASGTAPLSYQWRFNGANISGATASSYTRSNVQSTDAGSYSVGVTNAVGGVLSANATLTVNSPPSLSLGVSRAAEQVVTFETIVDYANDHVMFRKPANSGSTSAFINTTATNYSMVVTAGIPAGNTNGNGSKALKVGWTFKTGTTNAWIRLTTASATLIPSPAFDFKGRVRFDIYSDKSIKLALGVRETGSSVAVGANGGVTGAIEWVGATGATGAPVCTRTINAGAWTTVEFDLRAEPCYSFNAGNGVLDGNQGVLEHMAIVPNGGLSAYTVYVDNFQMIYTNSLPAETVTMNANSALTFAAVATDPDAGQTITYSLDAGAPSGASINASTGAFTWTPTAGSGTNTITVRATDNGSPSQSEAKTISVVVNTDPLGVMSSESSAFVQQGDSVLLTWPAVPGNTYQIQFRQAGDLWLNLGAPITASADEEQVDISQVDQDAEFRIIEPGASSAEQ